MIEPVAYRVDSTIYNHLIDAEYAVREIEHLRSSIGMGDGLIPKPVYIEPLYTEDRLKNKIELTATEFELLAKVCRGIQPFQKIEQHIKIVHNMKWFVRSKEQEGEDEDGDECYLFLSGSNLDDLEYLIFDYARAFDTKEEAELWVNPLTEAVQLPVEDK